MRFPFRWLARNVGLLLLAFFLSVIVWVSAVIAADPNEECSSPTTIPLEPRALPDGHLLIGEIPETVNIRLKAPHSVCMQMAADDASVQAWLSLADLEVGAHSVEVEYRVAPGFSPVRVLGVSPVAIDLTIEEFAVRAIPLEPHITGEPAAGYSLGLAILSDSRIVISGTRTLVDSVDSAVVSLDVTDASDEIIVDRAVMLVDRAGNPVTGLKFSPTVVNIRQIVNRPGTFREVIVRVIYTGAPADGYRLTSITPSPQIITVFASDPQLINAMPGFVETEAIDLTGATDDIEQRLRLNLPEGVYVDGEQSVLVLVGIAAIESSITLNLTFEAIGLPPGLQAILAPATVEVILSGPLPILLGLQPLDIRVVIDLAGLEPGTYTLTPRIEIIPIGLTVDSILPSAIDVTLILAPTPTPTPPGTPGTPSPTPSPTPTSTPTPASTSTPLPQ